MLPWRSQDVGGSSQLWNGGLRALEKAWDDFLLEAFFCQVWSFSVFMGRLWVAPGGVDLRLWRSQEVRGSPELQNGGLRAFPGYPKEEGLLDSRLSARRKGC